VFERCIYSKFEKNIPDIDTHNHRTSCDLLSYEIPLNCPNCPSAILFKLCHLVFKLNFWRGAQVRFTSRPEARGSGPEAISRVGSRLPRRKVRKGSEGRELESGVRLHINSRWQTGVCQLPRRGSGVGAWQRPAQSGSSSAGLGSWGEFSRPSAPEWYHERRAVAHVSQDPSPLPHCVSFSYSRPSPCSEFLKKVNSRPKKSKTSLDSRPSGLGSGGQTRLEETRVVYIHSSVVHVYCISGCG